MSKTERSPDELALSPRALADAQNAAAAEIVGRAFERGLSEEDVALALREREAAQAAAAAGAAAGATAGATAAGATGAAPAPIGAGAPIQGGEALSADDAAELARDTIPRRGPLALPRVVAATKPRMQGVALPVPEHDPSLAAEPSARGEGGESAAVPASGRRVWALALLVLGAGALALWWWSKRADPPQQPTDAASATPVGSQQVRVPPPPEQTASSAAAPASASAAPQVAPSASVSASTTAAVPSAKASAKPSATAQASTGPSTSASVRAPTAPTTTSTGGIYILEGDP